MKPATRLFATATFLLAVSPCWANLITNGSFATPSAPPGFFSNYLVGSTALTGWLVTGPAGTEVSTVSGSFSQNGVTFNAQSGSQWLDLTGAGSNSREGVSQTVATTVGDKYQLSFYIGNTTGGSIFGTTSTVDVLLNGVATFADTNSNVSNTDLNWELFTQTFVAGSASTALDFVNGDPGNDNSNGLENIVLVDLGPSGTHSVPEPATLSLLVLCLAGIGFARPRAGR